MLDFEVGRYVKKQSCPFTMLELLYDLLDLTDEYLTLFVALALIGLASVSALYALFVVTHPLRKHKDRRKYTRRPSPRIAKYLDPENGPKESHEEALDDMLDFVGKGAERSLKVVTFVFHAAEALTETVLILGAAALFGYLGYLLWGVHYCIWSILAGLTAAAITIVWPIRMYDRIFNPVVRDISYWNSITRWWR